MYLPRAFAARKSAYSGSAGKAAFKQGGRAGVFAQSKSRASPSQTITPSATLINIFSAGRLCNHHSTSLRTHGDLADEGDARSKKYSDSARACSIERQSAGLAERLVLSRKIRIERRRYQGLANRPSDDCSDAANRSSESWLYDTKALYIGSVTASTAKSIASLRRLFSTN